MATLQERLQIKRAPIDKWSIKEQLCLVSAVARIGDQNWMSVSRSLKPFAEPNRPADWFSQKNCAAQYGLLLENVETPKRKKRSVGTETLETPGESIMRKLMYERKIELRQQMADEKREYLKLKQEMDSIRSETVNETDLERMCKEIDEEEKQKEKDSDAYAQWLKQREERKLEVERVFRPVPKLNTPLSQKRKLSDSLEPVTVEPGVEEPDTPKPALSPLLTSLLKTPTTPSFTVTSASLLRTTVTSPKDMSPTIASLLNTTTPVTVSPSLQQLVTTAIGQENVIKTEPIEEETIEQTEEKEMQNEIAEEAKESELEPEQLLEPVIKSEIIESISQENEELTTEETKSEPEVKTDIPETKETETEIEKEQDVFDFDNSEVVTKETETENIEVNKQQHEEETIPQQVEEIVEEKESENPNEKPEEKEEEATVPATETVEVVAEDEDSDSEMNKKVSELKQDIIKAKSDQIEIKEEKQTSVYDEYDFDDSKKSDEKSEDKPQQPPQSEPEIDASQISHKSTLSSDFSEAFFDDVTMEVTKVEKSGKIKRDYSRTKKKEEKELDLLLTVEKVELDDEVLEETESEKDSHYSGDKIKKEERSNSPWTEEEEISLPKTRRRMSGTPATPCDSIPNSPASGIVFDDDRDYRTWKKSVMLVYSRLAAHKCASLFLKPITDDQAPGYHSMIYRPMDLQTLRRNIENGVIRTTIEFQRDALLMFNNAIMFNKSNEMVFNMARQMQQEGLQQIQILLQAQTQPETPARRETRTSESSNLKRKRGQDDFLLKPKKRRDE